MYNVHTYAFVCDVHACYVCHCVYALSVSS